MEYCISDIHGEYDLFCRLMENIGFSGSDELYVLGDMTDKGPDSVKLCDLLRSATNIHCIIGNHEYDFLKTYYAEMRSVENDFDRVLDDLRRYFPGDGSKISWEIVDWLDSLPFCIEKENFIGVHASVALDGDGHILPFCETQAEQFLYSRTLNGKDVLPKGGKCVIFGHTPVRNISGSDRFLFYLRDGASESGGAISDYCKIHIDTGVYLGGVLGCLCIDNCKEHYVRKV